MQPIGESDYFLRTKVRELPSTRKHITLKFCLASLGRFSTGHLHYSYSLYYIRFHPLLHMVTASITYGDSLYYIHTVPAIRWSECAYERRLFS